MTTVPENVKITGPAGDRYDEILTPRALELIAKLHEQLAERRAEACTACGICVERCPQKIDIPKAFKQVVKTFK